MCGIPQKAAAARFPGCPGKVLNKVIHRHAYRLQLFSGIQNLAPKLKFYFNFESLASRAAHPTTPPCLAATQLLRHPA